MKDSFAVRLIRERNRNGMSNADLAKKMEVSASVTWNWENGIAEPTGKMITRACRALGCSADYLLGLSDDPGVRKA
jgi:transcriptional regulator with XRE-family HTH domain